MEEEVKGSPIMVETCEGSPEKPLTQRTLEDFGFGGAKAMPRDEGGIGAAR